MHTSSNPVCILHVFALAMRQNCPCNMQVYVGEEVQLGEFLTSASDGGKCSASCPGLFTSRTHWTGERKGPELDWTIVK